MTPKKQSPSLKPTKSKVTPKPKRNTIKIAQNTQTSKGATGRPKKNTHPKAPPVSAKQLNTIKSMRNQLSAAINVNVAGANAAAFTSYANFVVGVYRRTWEPLIPSGLARSRIAKVSPSGVMAACSAHGLSARPAMRRWIVLYNVRLTG